MHRVAEIFWLQIDPGLYGCGLPTTPYFLSDTLTASTLNPASLPASHAPTLPPAPPAGVLDVPPAQLESPGADTLLRLLTQPGEQARELASALSSLAQGNADEARTATDVAIAVVDEVASMLSQRAGVGIDTLFPMRQAMLTGFGRSSSSSSGSGFGGAGSVDDGVSAGGLLQSSNARSDASAVTFGSLASVTTVSGTGAAAPVPVPVAAAVGANNGGVYSSAATAAGVSSPGVVAAVNTTMQSPQATSTSNGRQLVMRQL
jgi:hypothetical protein